MSTNKMDATTKENRSENITEELSKTLESIDHYDCNEVIPFSSRFWVIKLLYGKLDGKDKSTYVMEATSMLGDKETADFSYNDLVGKDAQRVRGEMDSFGYCPEGEFENVQKRAEYLKINNRIEKVENMDAKLAGGEQLIDDLKDRIRDYVLNNYESIASKKEGTYKDSTHCGAWLDAPMQIKQYDGVVLALVNSSLKSVWGTEDTSKIGHIKAQLVEDGFLINKEVKDVTLSTGNEKKCSLFRISPDIVGEE